MSELEKLAWLSGYPYCVVAAMTPAQLALLRRRYL